MCGYKYGEEIDYSISLLNVTDSIKLKEFDCDNFKLNYYIHNEIIVNGQVKNEDGLIFKFVDDKKDKIIAVVSLAASAIIHTETNYMELLPSAKIDVFAIDKSYQKLHYDNESETAIDRENHYYFSDCILAEVIRHCVEISEKSILVNFILLYANREKIRFYERNGFLEFEEYMEKENKAEINADLPMYMKLC